jgi:hypothetical protein
MASQIVDASGIAMNILAINVCYRQLPIYEGDDSADKENPR